MEVVRKAKYLIPEFKGEGIVVGKFTTKHNGEALKVRFPKGTAAGFEFTFFNYELEDICLK